MGDLGEVGGEILKAPDEVRDGLAAIEEADMLGAEVRVGPLVRYLADDRRELGKSVAPRRANLRATALSLAPGELLPVTRHQSVP